MSNEKLSQRAVMGLSATKTRKHGDLTASSSEETEQQVLRLQIAEYALNIL